MRQLPIWPSASGPGSYVAAAKALVTPHADLLVPWLHHRSLFIEPLFSKTHTTELSHLGVHALSIATMSRSYIFPYAPTLLQPDQINHYRRMLDVVVRDTQFTSQYKNFDLAVDGIGKMRRASELYDHEDDVYSAGFGLGDTHRFLHPTLRIYRNTFLAMGLRRGRESTINSLDYLACVKSLQRRLAAFHPSDAMQLSRRVLRGLSRLEQTNDTSTRRDICDAEFVYSGAATPPDPAFRMNNMWKFKECKAILKLSEVIRREHAPYCWTLAQFSGLEVPISDFKKLGLSGSPSSSMVWDHLRALVQVAATLSDPDVRPFLDDLSSTYSYLQQTPGLACHRTEKIWLNLDTSATGNIRVSDINSAWIDVEHLILFCPYDPGDIQAVRSYLKPYQDLLKRCGCQPVLTPILDEFHRPTHNSLPSQISRLWADSKLTDITFETEGKRVFAHKLVLAAASKKYEALFTGAWASSPDAFSAPIVLHGIGHATLLLMLDFAYHDHLDFQHLHAREGEEPNVVADKLDALLDLLAGADQWLMLSLHTEVESQILSNELYIRLDNVRAILKAANKTNSKRLAKYCRDYISVNPKTMAVADRDNGIDTEE
jgi:sacsin